MKKAGNWVYHLPIITDDDGNEEKILGFDRPKFDEVLGLA
jgi:hypothetical protein